MLESIVRVVIFKQIKTIKKIRSSLFVYKYIFIIYLSCLQYRDPYLTLEHLYLWTYNRILQYTQVYIIVLIIH